MARRNRNTRQFSGLALWYELMRQASEMTIASAEVISHRTRHIARALTNPSRADVGEFLLMWTEKVAAAQRAAQALSPRDVARSVGHGYDVYHRVARNARDTLSAQSRTPLQFMARYMQLLASSGRTINAMASAAEASARSTKEVMAPYHSASTRNAARLKKAKL